MAANPWQIYDKAMERIIAGEAIQLRTNQIKCAVVSTAYTPLTTGHEFYSDISAHVTSSADYPGDKITSGVVVTRSNGVITLDMNNINYGSAVTIRGRYGVLYDDTTTSDCLIAWAELTSDGTYVESTVGTFEIQINASGVATFTQT